MSNIGPCNGFNVTCMLVWHLSRSFLVILTLMESMQVLSMLCASSNTTIVFFGRSFDTSSAI